MKKRLFILLILLVIIIILLFSFLPKKTDNNIVKLGEVTHSVFYTPLYVAIEKGYFKEEGINIELSLISGADKVSSALLSGDIDVGFAGGESALYVYDQNTAQDYLMIFAGLTKRDGQFIVSKEKKENFNLQDLYNKEILVGRQTGMPALNFLNALKNAGIDKNKIKINYSIDFASLTGAFIGGTGEYVNLFEPNATKIEKEKNGYVVASIGKLSGLMPYTVFYAKKSYINSNKELLKKFNNAINKGLNYTLNNSEKDLAKVIAKQFPDENLSDLANLISRYKQNDSWLENTFISEQLLNNLENLLLDNNLLTKKIAYTDIINNL